ncbi:MAG: RNA methyltransferase [Prevotella sp.]|nr:RNA methyltransferase [Prevotella sp.]
MIGKNTIKWVHSLEMKKNRKREQLFVAEGPKVVGDLLAHYRPRAVFATSEWEGRSSVPSYAEVETVSDDELRRLSFLQHPQQVLAVFEMGEQGTPSLNADRLTLVLDGVQDPGNLGTIIRIADWFGIDNIICSPETADAYNPKVVQATMGSLARVNVSYTPLLPFLSSLPHGLPVYGTLLDGHDIYGSTLSGGGIIIMGNEGNGISEEVRTHVTHPLLIPNFRQGDGAESLNVAVATAITCSEFCRRLNK